MVEHLVYTERVGGSSPSPPTKIFNVLCGYLGWPNSKQLSFQRSRDLAVSVPVRDGSEQTITLRLVGTAKPDWDGNGRDGHSLTIWSASFNPPATLRRTRVQDANAPWLTDFPKFKCWAATIRLPRPGQNRVWSYRADAMNRQIGGETYWRKAGLQNGVVRTVMSRSVQKREISAEQAQAQNAAIPGFDNTVSSVFEASKVNARQGHHLPFGEGTDWASNDGACIAHP